MLGRAPLRGLRDRVLALRSMPNLSGLDDEGFVLLAERSRNRTFSKGEWLAREGEEIECVFIMLEGRVRVNRLGSELLIVDRPGGVGFLSTLANDDNGIDALALTGVQVLEVPVDALRDSLAENFSLVRNSLRLMAAQMLVNRDQLPAAADYLDEVGGAYPERSPTLVERIIQIRSGTLFEATNLDAITDLCRRMTEIRVEPGHIFWRSGESADSTMRIDHGVVRCSTDDGKQVRIGPGFTFGVTEAFAELPRTYTAEAETRVVAQVSQLESMLAVLESQHNLALGFIEYYANVLLNVTA